MEKLEAKLEKVKGEEKSIVKCLRAENAELEKRTELLEGEVEELQRRLRTFEPAADWGEPAPAPAPSAVKEAVTEATRLAMDCVESGLVVAKRNWEFYMKEVKHRSALEQQLQDMTQNMEELKKENAEMLEALADKDKRIVKAVSRVVELEKGAGKAEEVERLTNLVKALCAENQRLHDQFGS